MSNQLPPWLIAAPTPTAAPVILTAAQLARALEIWQSEFERAPEQFYTDSEMVRINPVSLAEQRASTLFAYLSKAGAR